MEQQKDLSQLNVIIVLEGARLDPIKVFSPFNKLVLSVVDMEKLLETLVNHVMEMEKFKVVKM